MGVRLTPSFSLSFRFCQGLAARVDAGEYVFFEDFKYLIGDGDGLVFHALTSLPSSKARR